MTSSALNVDTNGSPTYMRRDVLLCLAAALVVYLTGLGNGFTYDDTVIIKDNPRIRSLDQIPEIWQTHWWLDPNVDESYGIHQLTDRLYRPLSMTTFSLNYAMHGLNPFGYFLVNVLLHVMATGLVWRLAWVLIHDRWVALAAGLLFAVHPVHSEAVANGVGRAELLSAVFMLLGLLVLTPRAGLPRGGRGLLAAGLFTLALFAKESAICSAPVVLIVLLYRVRSLGHWPKHSWWAVQTGCAALPALIYLPARYYALDGTLIANAAPSFLMNPLASASPLGQFYGVFTVAGHYVRLLIAPIKLSSDYSYAAVTDEAVITPMTVLGLIGAVALLIALVGWLRKSEVWRQAALLVTMFLASYVLISNAFIHIGVTVAERLMYWPSVPMAILFAVLIVNGFRKLAAAPDANPGLLRLLRIGGVSLLVVFGLRTAVRAPEWASNETLSLADSQSQPRSAKMSDMVAVEYYLKSKTTNDPAEKQRLLAEGHAFADRALELYPTFTTAMLTKALLCLASNDRKQALEYLDAASAADVNDPLVRAMYAQVLDPDREARLATLRAQVAAEPNRPEYLLSLGEELLVGADPVPAFQLANRLIKLTPDDVDAQWLRARAALACAEYPAAAEALKRVLALDPNRWEAHTNLSYVLLNEETFDPEGALAHAKEALRLAPRRLETHHNYAQVLLALKRTDEAIAKLEFILASPDFPHDNPLYAAIEGQLREIKRERQD